MTVHKNRPTRAKLDWLRNVLFVSLLVSCGGGGDNGGNDGGENINGAMCSLAESSTEDVTLNGSCTQETLLGAILLESQADFSFLDAKVINGVLPSSVREEEMNMDGCRLMRKRSLFCDPGCGSNEVCTVDNECAPFPERQDLGSVCVAGLSEGVTMTAESPSFHYFNTTIAHPSFVGGERIEVRSTGGVYGDFAMTGVGVSPIMLKDDQWNIVEGEPLSVNWETSDVDTLSTISLSVNIDQHGSAPLLLECEIPDTGSATIPTPLIEALMTSGVSGFPNGKIIRHTVDSVPVEDGCIEFVVQSPESVAVRVAGHTPCTSDANCPSGQTCDTINESCI